MSECKYCKKQIWFWQKKMGEYHSSCWGWASSLKYTLLKLKILDYIEEHKPNTSEGLCNTFNISLRELHEILNHFLENIERKKRGDKYGLV